MRVPVIIDEASLLGHLEVLETMVAFGAGYGVQEIFIYQSRGQLTKSWPNDNGTILDSNSSSIYFGTNDYPTAEAIGKRIGMETVAVVNDGRSGGTSSQATTSGTHQNVTQSKQWNTSRQQQQRHVLTPDEILALPPRVAITFHPGGIRPVCTWLLRYYEEPRLFRHRWFPKTRAMFGTLIWSCLLLALSGCVALLATQLLIGR